MRSCLISILSLFTFFSVNSQSITVSTFEKQIVYTNIKNPLNVSAFNISPENIKLETSNGIITKENGVFYWIPNKNNNNTLLLVFDKENKSIVDTFKFRVSQAAIPAIAWKERMFHSGFPDWRKINKLYLDMPICCNHLTLDTLCKILSFDILITYPITKRTVLIHSNNDSITKEFKALVPAFSPGVKVEFLKIKMYVAWNNPSIFYYDDYFKYVQNLSFTLY